jgi:hypothetical protein
MNDIIDIEVSIKRYGTPNWKKIFVTANRSAIDKKHQEISEKHPYSFVNFMWDKGQSFVFGAPHQMMLDQENLDIQEYVEKWYLV